MIGSIRWYQHQADKLREFNHMAALLRGDPDAVAEQKKAEPMGFNDRIKIACTTCDLGREKSLFSWLDVPSRKEFNGDASLSPMALQDKDCAVCGNKTLVERTW